MNVIIYLGSKCDMNCKYCHREIEPDKELNEDFIRSLKNPRFFFKGGEPLLYIDTIDEIRQMHHNAPLFITTNAKTIDEHQEFLIMNYVDVHISYDYDPQGARKFIPNFATPVPFNITSTMYHGNTDLMRWCDEHYNMCGELGKWFNFFPHVMHCTNDNNEEIALTKEDYDEIAECYKKALIDLSDKRLHPIRRKLSIISNNNYKFGETRCMNENTIRCNVAGDAFSCSYIRDTSIPFGNSTEERKKIISERFPECAQCSLYKYCGSMCVQSRYHNLECYHAKQMYSLVSKYATPEFNRFVREEELCLKSLMQK